jgi:tetratricopeptide (TPR) repeat protein
VKRKREPPSGNVTSIVPNLQRRQIERMRDVAERSHRRELQVLVESADMMRELESSEFDDMIAELEDSDDPDAADTSARLRCARAMRSCVHGDEAGGLAEWEAIMAQHPSMALPYVMRARWRLQNQQQPRKALRDLDRATGVEPDDPGAYYWRARCHEMLGDAERALANYRRAAALDPASIDTLHALAKALSAHGPRPEARVAWDRLIAVGPGYVDFHMGRARLLEDEGDLQAALVDYDRIVSLDPGAHALAFCRALCLSGLGRVEQAVEAMQRVADAAPDTPAYLRALGDLRTQAEQPALALAPLCRAIELEATAAGYATRGRAHEALGDVAAALADYDRAAELDPDDATAGVHRLMLRATQRPQEMDLQALAAELDRLATRMPNSAELADLQAVTLSTLGDHPGALKAWDRLIALSPDVDGETYLKRAVAHARLGHVQEAFDDATHAIERSPTLAAAYVARGIYRTHLEDDADEALADLDRAVSLAPDDASARFQRAEIHSASGEYEEALADYDAAIAIAPNVGKIYYERASCRAHLGDHKGARADRAHAKKLGFRRGARA